MYNPFPDFDGTFDEEPMLCPVAALALSGCIDRSRLIMMYRLAFITVVAFAGMTAVACPKTVPVGLVSDTVVQDVVANGLRMSIAQVRTVGSVADEIARIDAVWQGEGYKVKRSEAAGWSIVSALSKTCLATLQLKAVGKTGSFGYFAYGSTEPGGTRSVSSWGVPMPVGARVLSNVTSEDAGRKGATIAMTSQESLQRLTQFLAEGLLRMGWNNVHPHGVINAKTGQVSQLISAQRNRQQIQIMMWSAKETQIVMTVGDSL